MDKQENPFGEVVKSMQQSFTPAGQQPQFGLAEVLTENPVSVCFAGMEFARRELLINYTLEPYHIIAMGTHLSGRLTGPTNICAEGAHHTDKKVLPNDDRNLDSRLSGDVEITDTGLQRGDLLFAYYSQTDQRLVLLCKVV